MQRFSLFLSHLRFFAEETSEACSQFSRLDHFHRGYAAIKKEDSKTASRMYQMYLGVDVLDAARVPGR